MGLSVGIEVTFLDECFVASFAGIWFLSSVYSDMFVVIPLLVEGFVACATCVVLP